MSASFGTLPIPWRPLHPLIVTASLVLGSLVLTGAMVRTAPPSLRPWPIIALWLGSIAMLLMAARRLEQGNRPSPSKPHLARGEVAFLLAITTAALLVRTIDLDGLPNTFSGDEGETGSWARTVLAGDLRDPFATGWAGHPSLWFFLQALSLWTFGDDVFGLRILSALLGVFAIPVLYLFVRSAFGRSEALVATTLLAALHMHVHYSRVGLNSVGDPLLMLLALWALLAGLRTGSPFKLALAGVIGGIAQHFYVGSRLVPLVLLTVVLHQLIFNRVRAATALPFVPLAFLGFWIGYGPGMRVPLYQWDNFNARLSGVGIFQSGWFDEQRARGESLFDIFHYQVTQSVGAFTHVADRSYDYNAQMPMLDRVSAALFLLGIVICLRNWRCAESAALLAWLAGTVVAGGILLLNPPQSHRYVTAVPAACVLVSLAIVRSTRALVSVIPRARRLATPSVALLVMGIALWNLNFYFREYTPRYMYGGFRGGEEVTAIGRYLQKEGAGSFVYFFGAPRWFFDVGTIRFLAPDVPGADVSEPLESSRQLPPKSAGRPLFVFIPERLAELAVVRVAYPGGVLQTLVSKVDRAPLFYVYRPSAPRSRSMTARRLERRRGGRERCEPRPPCVSAA